MSIKQRHNKKVATLWAILFLLCSTSLMGQNGTPYDRYGYGSLSDNSMGPSRAMGGVGYALQGNRQINVMNPASYVAMDSLTFLLDMGANIQFSTFREGSKKESPISGDLEYLALQFPITRFLAASIGVIPYSDVSYNFGTTYENGNANYFQGTGGLTQTYLGLAARPFKGFSLGANVSYLFGDIVHTGEYTYAAADTYDGLYQSQMTVRNVHLQFGLQYGFNMTSKDRLTLGVVYSPKINMGGSLLDVKALTNSGKIVQLDTVKQQKLNGYYQLPQTFGFGISYQHDKKLTLAADATYQDWSAAKFAGETDVMFNRMKFSLGAEYWPARITQNYFKQIRYRAGLFYNNNYQNVLGSQLNEFGVTCGLGLPINKVKSVLNLAFEYVNKQPTNKNLISQDYFRISLSITFNEAWFYQFKIN